MHGECILAFSAGEKPEKLSLGAGWVAVALVSCGHFLKPLQNGVKLLSVIWEEAHNKCSVNCAIPHFAVEDHSCWVFNLLQTLEC